MKMFTVEMSCCLIVLHVAPACWTGVGLLSHDGAGSCSFSVAEDVRDTWDSDPQRAGSGTQAVLGSGKTQIFRIIIANREIREHSESIRIRRNTIIIT